MPKMTCEKCGAVISYAASDKPPVCRCAKLKFGQVDEMTEKKAEDVDGGEITVKKTGRVSFDYNGSRRAARKVEAEPEADDDRD